jgi:hypothetical protein
MPDKTLKLRLLSVTRSQREGKKWVAAFSDGKHIHFGASGYQDYTQHKDPERRKAYIERHRADEDWKDPQTPGCLSRYILWEHTSKEAAVAAFKRRFGL